MRNIRFTLILFILFQNFLFNSSSNNGASISASCLHSNNLHNFTTTLGWNYGTLLIGPKKTIESGVKTFMDFDGYVRTFHGV